MQRWIRSEHVCHANLLKPHRYESILTDTIGKHQGLDKSSELTDKRACAWRIGAAGAVSLMKIRRKKLGAEGAVV